MGAALYCKSCRCHWYSMGGVMPEDADCPDCGEQNARFDVPWHWRLRWWINRHFGTKI